MSAGAVRRRTRANAPGLLRTRPRSLAAAATLVVGLHAAVLLMPLQASGSRSVRQAHALSVRLVPLTAPAVVAPAASPLQTAEVAAKPSATSAQHQSTDATLRDDGPVAREPLRSHPAASKEIVERAAAASSVTQSPAADALAPAPDYLAGAQLDPGPKPLDDIEPEYPESAHLQEGKVVLRLLISDTGAVDDVAVVRSEPKGLFESAALDAFRVARFSPGKVLGMPVKSQIMVEVEFLPINRGARISGRTY